MPHFSGTSTASTEKRNHAGAILVTVLILGATGAAIGFLIAGPPGAAAGFFVGVAATFILPIGARAGVALYNEYQAHEELQRRTTEAHEAEIRSRQEADRANEAMLKLEKACLRQAQEILSEAGQRKINNIYDSIKMAKRMAQRQGIAFDEEAAKQSIKEDYGIEVCFLEELQDAKVRERLKGIEEALNLSSIPPHLVIKKRIPEDKGTVTEPLSTEETTVPSQTNPNEKVTFLKSPAGDMPAKFLGFFRDASALNLATSIKNAPNAQACCSLDDVTVLVLPNAFS